VNKFFQKKPKILSPRVVVRPHTSWPYRLVAIVISCLLLLLLSWGMYEAGSQSANTQNNNMVQEKLEHLYDPGTCRQTKKQKLCAQIGDLIQQLQISNTANKNLAKQVKLLANENDHLKEKLVFFQHLMSGNTKDSISIYQFSLKETQTPGKYRYTLTLIQGGERPSDFKGNLRFQVKLLQNDRSKTIPLINKNSTQDFPINFKFFHRLEESFKAPTDIIVESLQVQLYESNNSKAILTQTVQPAL
jgi:hypothetical protein